MKLKSLLPWVCLLGLLIGLGWLYAVNQQQAKELVTLREESQQLQKLRADLEEAKATGEKAETEELAQLRKDKEELLSLRNAVQQLRGERQQLATQVQQAQAQAQGAQAQVEALRAKAAQPGVPIQPAVATHAVAPPGQPAMSPEQAQAAACINNLRLIDGAKQQWALERQKPPGALLTAADIAPYLKGNTLPVCPAGGVYTLNQVGMAPLCNIPGHTISK
jgi:hypothetical protein